MCTTMRKKLGYVQFMGEYKEKNIYIYIVPISTQKCEIAGKIPLHQSCCEKCLNFDNVSSVIAKYLQGTYKELNQAVDSMLSSYSGFFPNITVFYVSVTNVAQTN